MIISRLAFDGLFLNYARRILQYFILNQKPLFLGVLGEPMFRNYFKIGLFTFCLKRKFIKSYKFILTYKHVF